MLTPKCAQVLALIKASNRSLERSIQYELDLMIWENSLEPTWLALPTPPQYVKRLQVTVRTFSHIHLQWLVKFGASVSHLSNERCDDLPLPPSPSSNKQC